MRFRTVSLVLGVFVLAGAAAAQGPPPRVATPAAAVQIHGTMLQVMRGILFHNSNVIFMAQDVDPATVKQADDPSTSPDPLTSAYNGWQAVENAGVAMAEAANLLTVPGRMCSSGRPAPVANADWQRFVQGLRDAGMVAYRAGQARNQDRVLEAADAVATACGNCHDVYREKTPAQGGARNRCLPS